MEFLKELKYDDISRSFKEEDFDELD